MSEAKKARCTASRTDVNAVKRGRAEAIRGWLEDRKAAALERKRLDEKAALLAGPEGGGSGVTVEMRQISAQAAVRELEWIVINQGPNCERRRNHPSHRSTPASKNTPYVNPARDLKPGRRLRTKEN